MSATRELDLAVRALRTCRTHLRAAREDARRLDLDERVLVRLQATADEESATINLRDDVGLAEAGRRVATRKHGSTR